MLLRLLFLISFLGYTTGPDFREEEDSRLGGQGFARVVLLVCALGLLTVLGLVALAIMSLTGNFDMEFFDPVI
jgi:hypothetical protein